MAFTRSAVTTNIIRALADQPTETATQLKTKFDEYAENDKAFTNDTLLAELEATTGTSGAENIGSKTIAGITGNTVWAQISNLFTQLYANFLSKTNTTAYTPTVATHPATKGYVDTTIAGVVLGQIPDDSLTNAKLATDIKVGSLASLTTTEKGSVVGAINELASGGDSSSLKDANDVYLISPVSTVTDAVNYIEVANAVTTASPAFTAKGTDSNIDLSLSAKGTGSVKTLTQPVASTCIRNITISTSNPSGGSDGDIWIKYA